MFIVLSVFVNRLQKYNFSRNYANFLKEKLRLWQIFVTFSLIHLERGVFRHQQVGFLLEVLLQFLADIFLVNHQTEHEFTEPAGRHNQTTLLSPAATP